MNLYIIKYHKHVWIFLMEITIKDAFSKAIEAHRIGNFELAKIIYEAVLKKKPHIQMQILTWVFCFRQKVT